jgi:hypothetical protein
MQIPLGVKNEYERTGTLTVIMHSELANMLHPDVQRSYAVEVPICRAKRKKNYRNE